MSEYGSGLSTKWNRRLAWTFVVIGLVGTLLGVPTSGLACAFVAHMFWGHG